MRRTGLSSRNRHWALKVLIGLAGLSALACESSMNFTSPTAPTSVPPWSPNPGTRTLQISGVLEAESGSCLEATVLYDGVEVAGARLSCEGIQECSTLRLRGSVNSETGHHTISFKVLRQSRAVLDYVVRGSVLVDREGLQLGGVTLPLGPSYVRLGAGDSVSFDIDFREFTN